MGFSRSIVTQKNGTKRETDAKTRGKYGEFDHFLFLPSVGGGPDLEAAIYLAGIARYS
jgi:hypothetical protein